MLVTVVYHSSRKMTGFVEPEGNKHLRKRQHKILHIGTDVISIMYLKLITLNIICPKNYTVGHKSYCFHGDLSQLSPGTQGSTDVTRGRQKGKAACVFMTVIRLKQSLKIQIFIDQE